MGPKVRKNRNRFGSGSVPRFRGSATQKTRLGTQNNGTTEEWNLIGTELADCETNNGEHGYSWMRVYHHYMVNTASEYAALGHLL